VIWPINVRQLFLIGCVGGPHPIPQGPGKVDLRSSTDGLDVVKGVFKTFVLL
jgi:hypothetical protein